MSVPSFRRALVKAPSTTLRDIEIPCPYQKEPPHSLWWSLERVLENIQSLSDDPVWNSIISCMVLAAIVWSICWENRGVVAFLDILYNVLYAVHVFDSAYNVMIQLELSSFNLMHCLGFMVDIVSYSHYIVRLDTPEANAYFKLTCYYLRLHRPFRYFWSVQNYNIKGSVIGTTLMYCYIFLVLRFSWSLVWFHIEEDALEYPERGHRRIMSAIRLNVRGSRKQPGSDDFVNFLTALYIIDKMFIPIGPSRAPMNDTERIASLLIMLSGCLVVTGAAVASLSLVFSIYMRPGESFRARYRLIMREMKESHIPQGLREKVRTFYKMYWQKQKAVCSTELLPVFPPTIPATIHADIYFIATQKSRILRDLSYQFLSEVAKSMQTIHYIPGDTIIKRSTRKSSIIYITYGDIEMLTAEDDSTAILRLSRGTILSPCGPCPVAGCARAHVEIRANTFCTAHVLTAAALWKTVLKHGRERRQAAAILNSFDDHFDKVKRHFFFRTPSNVKYKSSILHFKRNLMKLQETQDETGKLLLSDTDAMLEIAGCYVKRNRTCSALTDEADAICLRSTFPCILQPNSSMQNTWHFFVACIIIIVCVTHPYNLVFKKAVSMQFRFFDYVVTGIYALDLMVHLSTGANVEDGIPITLTQISSQQARSRWFVLDIVGTLPIFEFIGEGHYAGLNKLLRLPKVFRILKALEVECVYQSNALQFFSFSLMILISCYFIAALQHDFMCAEFKYCRVSNFTHSPFWEKMPSSDETVKDTLLFSLYWSISMISFTSHMETLTEDENNQILLSYTMLLLEICIILHIFIEAVYSATIMVTTAMRENFDATIGVVKRFLVRNEVDTELRKRFLTYLQLCWYSDKAYSTSNKKKSIFHDLPPHVYQDIVTRQRSKYILCIPFMKLLHRDDLRNVSSNAKMFYTSPNEIILNTGDITNEMYVIKQGICEILSPETKTAVGELRVRNHFGVLECLLRLPAFYTIRAVTHVQMFCISRKHLVNALKIPKINDAIEFAKEQPEYNSLQLRRIRFVSYEPERPAPNTERFRVPRKHEEDSAFMQPFNKLGFLYIFPRFTIRPDGRYLVHCEWVRATCALLSAVVYPGYPYLVLQWPRLYWLAMFLDFTAYFDLFQRMLVGYFNDKGILVYHPSSTAAHYLKGALIIDLFSCLPLEFLESPWKNIERNGYKITTTKQLLMLNRLLQLYRTPSALLGLVKHLRRDILLVIKAIPLFIVHVNVLTCFMVMSSVSIFHSNQGDWFIQPRNDKGGSWIKLFKDVFRFNITESPWTLHLTCMFWVVYETTTTGYNCFNPSNLQMMQVLLFGMVTGVLIITYFSVRIISIRANVNKLLAAFQQNMKDMAVFMREENMSRALQREVVNYYTNDWKKMGGTDYRTILKLCDQVTLRSDAILNIFGETFMKCPILVECDISLLRMMGRAIRSYHFLKGTVIVEKDDIIGDLYFVDTGNIEITDNYDNVENVIQLRKGSLFGNLKDSSTIRSPLFVKATSRVHLMKINAKVFHNIIKDFPSVIQLLHKHQSTNKSYIEGVMPIVASRLKERNIQPFISRHRRFFRFFHFESPYTQVYLIIISLSCIYADVYNAGFLDNRFALIVALYAHDLAFYWKFIIQYFLPYVSEEDEDITNELMNVRKRYFNKEFKIDILSCLPIELFCFLRHRDPWILFAWLRLNRTLRIVTVYSSLKRYHRHYFTNLTITTIFSVLIWFTVFIHVSTCIWYFIGIMEEAKKPKASWFYDDKGDAWCESEYVCSLYFVLTTFAQNGVGDILPKQQSEVIFVSILQMVSTMTYMVYVGEFSNLIQYQSFRSFSYYCKYLELQEFLKNNRVSKNLVQLVNRYSMHLWRESRGVQLPHLLEAAPSCLKLKLMSAAYLHHLTNHHIFKCCEPAFLRQLVGHLKLYTYNKGTYVVKQNEITNAMYIIHTGRVSETCETETESKLYFSGQYFGVVQGLVVDFPHTHSYQAVGKSRILTLCLDDWEYLLSHFPKSKECIYKFITYDDDASENKDRDKPTKRVTIADSPPVVSEKTSKEQYGRVSHSASNDGVKTDAKKGIPLDLTKDKKEYVDKESKKVDEHIFKLDDTNVFESTSQMLPADLNIYEDIRSHREVRSDSNISFELKRENLTKDNSKMYLDLHNQSVENYTEQIHRSTLAIEKNPSRRSNESEDIKRDGAAIPNNSQQKDDAIALYANSTSLNESDSKTSSSEKRQLKRDEPSQ